MSDCAPTSKLQLLEQLGIELWLAREPNGAMVEPVVEVGEPQEQPLAEAGGMDPVVKPRDDVQDLPRDDAQDSPRDDLHIWLGQYPDSLAAWQLLDAILAAVGLHRADLKVGWGGTKPTTRQAPCLCFADDVAEAFPSLTTLIKQPHLKKQVWQQLKAMRS